MATTSQRRSSRLAPSEAAPVTSARASRKRKPSGSDTASALKKPRGQKTESVLESHTQTPSDGNLATVKVQPARRRSARAAIHVDDVKNSTDEDAQADVEMVLSSSDDPPSDVPVAPRTRAARLKKDVKVETVELTAPSQPSRHNPPKRGVKAEPQDELSIKPTPRLRKPSKQAAVKEESGNDTDDFIDVKDMKKLRPTPTKATKPVARLTEDGDIASSESDDIKPLRGGRATRPTKARASKTQAAAATTLGKPAARGATARGKGKQKAGAAKPPLDSGDDDSSDFVAESSSSDDGSGDDVTNWATALKSKAARGKDLVDGTSSSSADDDAPLKPKKQQKQQKQKQQTPVKPRQPRVAKPAKKDADSDGSDGGPAEKPEPTEYPHYEVTYAPTGRSRCKTCEKTLTKGELIVSIRLRHSRFGIMAYHKHVECTLLNDQVSKELHGFQDLDKEDVERVQSYMVLNSKRGVEDERVALGDDAFIKREVLPAGKPSQYLTAALLPYQQEGLAWMKAQEASKYRGGILADEMGMGKTIQAIATMLENVKDKRQDGAVGGGTLIICPVIACMQWKSEIERFVEANHLTILVYHGPKRTSLTTHLASYDVVLTTYSILESEGRKLMEAEKVACEYCNKLFVPEKLVPHNKYFCGPDAIRTAKQMKQQKGKGKAAVAKKAKKLSDSDDSSSDDAAPIKRSIPPPKKAKKPVKKGRSPLHEVEWTRIILDEAHYIKDKKCSTARSVFRLKSTYKWCLSGTPLQNRIGELFSLVRFLQIDPQAYYECAECDCKQLDFSILQGHCKFCDHTAMQHYSFFNKKIVIPIQGFGYVAEGKLAMLRLQNDLLRHVLLRRTKESRADDISLPPKLVRVRRDALDEREKDFYESIYTQSKAQFNTYVSAGTLLNNYAHIFDLLIRLRQAVDHPYLVIYSKINPALQVPTPDVPARDDLPLVAPSTDDLGDDDDDGGFVACGFCHEPVEQPVESACRHVFCKACVEEYVESLPVGAPALCPTCDEPLTVDISSGATGDLQEDAEPSQVVETKARHIGKNSLLRRLPNVGDFQSSTKIEALMEELHLMREDDPSAKAIVFSQFVNMLDLIEHRLRLAGMKCSKLSGGMPMAQRDRLLTEFREDPSITVFLISLKAGGVALNLTVASHIFLMDPWWNPAAEHQAIDRTHRLGQFKPIRATRFVIANTIEERILKLQEKKQLVFEGTVGSSTAALARLTIEDLRFLFSG